MLDKKPRTVFDTEQKTETPAAKWHKRRKGTKRPFLFLHLLSLFAAKLAWILETERLAAKRRKMRKGTNEDFSCLPSLAPLCGKTAFGFR
jgi:hypothetical protein